MSGLLLEFHHEKHRPASAIYLENTPAMQSIWKQINNKPYLKTKPNQTPNTPNLYVNQFQNALEE